MSASLARRVPTSSRPKGTRAIFHPVAVSLEDLPVFLRMERTQRKKPIVARVTMIQTSALALVEIEE